MNENQEMQEENLDNTAVVENENNENVEETQAQDVETKEANTFSQDQVNDIVRSRLERYEKKLFSDYGVENRDGLNELIGRAQSYEVMKERYDTQKLENASLKEENAFLRNKVNPNKYDDIRAYYKGKGLDFSEESLINELKTHGEWLSVAENTAPQTTITALGTDPQMSIPKKDEREVAAKLFGLNKLI